MVGESTQKATVYLLRQAAGVVSTARIEGAPFHRAPSASKGVHQATPLSPLTALSSGSYNPLKFLSVTN